MYDPPPPPPEDVPVETGAAARAGAAARGADDRERAGCAIAATVKVNPSRMRYAACNFMANPFRCTSLAVVYARNSTASIADFGQEWLKSTTS